MSDVHAHGDTRCVLVRFNTRSAKNKTVLERAEEKCLNINVFFLIHSLRSVSSS